MNRLVRIAGTSCIGAVVLLGCATDVETPPTSTKELQAHVDPEVVRQSTINPNAVAGIEKTFGISGKLLSEVIVDSLDYPANVEELAATGKHDSQGRTYAHSSGAFFDGTKEVRYEHIERVVVARFENTETKASGVSSPSEANVSPPVGPLLTSLLNSEPPDRYVRVAIRNYRPLTTSLRGNSAAVRYSSLSAAASEHAQRALRINSRKQEVQLKFDSLSEWLTKNGASNIKAMWLSGSLVAEVPLGIVQALTQHPDVDLLEHVADEKESHDLSFNGEDIKHSRGLNAGYFRDNGFDGDLASPDIVVAIIDGEGFEANHAGFNDDSGSSSRVNGQWNCTSSGCSTGQSASGNHGTAVAGLAVGDFRDNQISGQSSDWKLDRTGVCEECRVLLLDRDSNSTARENALELAVEEGADIVIQSSTPDGGTSCDSDYSTFDDAVYAAHESGVLYVNSAGNRGHSSGCNVNGMSESLAAFVVGGVGDDSGACDAQSDAYRTCGDYDATSLGGQNLQVAGTTFSGVISQVDAVTNACPDKVMTASSTTSTCSGACGCGTSFAAPLVAGAAGLLVDWFLDQHTSAIKNEGVLYTMLLGMTDRASGDSSYVSSGFNPQWGGGRLQMRYFGKDNVGWDETGPAGWKITQYNSLTSAVENTMSGSGPEPSGIQQYKAYMTFFEEDALDAADYDLYLYNGDCAGSLLASDVSRDLKSMARASSGISGEALCARVNPFHLPSGQSRRVVLYQYYSTDTDFR